MTVATKLQDLSKNIFEAMFFASMNSREIQTAPDHSSTTYVFSDGSKMIVRQSRFVEIQ
jgi:hypothetical protein